MDETTPGEVAYEAFVAARADGRAWPSWAEQKRSPELVQAWEAAAEAVKLRYGAIY